MFTTIVIGLGNVLMADEGVGVRVVERIGAEADGFPGVTFLDAGTAGMAALHALAGHRKAVFVDCALMGEPPGTLRRFTPAQAAGRGRPPGLSLHESDLFSILELSRQLGECPSEVVVFGIQPERIEPGPGLSEALAARLDQYVAAVRAELGPPAGNG
jgi:hydrogenase maturation protease